MVFGHPDLGIGNNILTCIYFFFFGCSYLEYYNTVLNLSDVLTDEFFEKEGFMTTFPLFYNTFNFIITIILTVLASKLKYYPFNIFANCAFILHLLLYIVSPIALVFLPVGNVRFWTMVVITTFSGVPTPMNSSVFMGLSGMFSSIHNAIFFVGMAAGGLLSWVLRFISNQIFPDDVNEDIFLTFCLNGFVVIMSYIMYFVMYYTVPLTKRSYAMSNAKGSSETKALVSSDGKENKDDDEDGDHYNKDLIAPQPDNIDQQPYEFDAPQSSKVPLSTTLKKLIINLLSIGLVFFVTLSTFPGMFTGTHYNQDMIEQQTTLQINNMIFMLGDLLSRFCVYIPIKSNKWIIFGLCVSRFLFYIPVFVYYFGEYTPIPMFFVMLLFSFTNGYFSAFAIQLANESMAPSEMKVGGNLVMMSMNIGLTLGSFTLFIFGHVLNNDLPAESSFSNGSSI